MEAQAFLLMYATNVLDADYFLPLFVCLSLDLNQRRRLQCTLRSMGAGCSLLVFSQVGQ